MSEYYLKPCPFCGGQATIKTIPKEFGVGKMFYVRCTACGAGTRAVKLPYNAHRLWEQRVQTKKSAADDNQHADT